MNASFYLIRHGMCDPVGKRISGRTLGMHLNEEGRGQALALVERLSEVPIHAIYSSPLERAIETAEPLSRKRDLPIHVSPAFHELDFGEWSGRGLEELETIPEWKMFNAFRGGWRIPGGELFLEVQARAVGELGRLAREHTGQKIAVFSHSDVIRAVILHALGSPVEFNLRLEVSPASVSVLHWGEWGPQLSRLNDTGPLR